MTLEAAAGSGGRRSAPALAAWGIAAALVFAALVALGTWQVHRLAWKTALIARVDARVHAAPVPPPPPAQWPRVDRAADEYLHVQVRGTFLDDRETLVQAVTAFGAGFWVVTPLRTAGGDIILVNRGFVPPERRDPDSRRDSESAGVATVTGLLRVSEPEGAFLRNNAPAAARWYSRDVPAIAAAHGLTSVAPYFIDADATPNPGGYPIGGLTVIAFPNNHLLYAATWYGLATMLAGACLWAVRDEYRTRRAASA